MKNSTAPGPHLSTEDQDQDHPHACYDGWVYIGHMAESEHDLDGEVVEYVRVPCRRCVGEDR